MYSLFSRLDVPAVFPRHEVASPFPQFVLVYFSLELAAHFDDSDSLLLMQIDDGRALELKACLFL